MTNNIKSFPRKRLFRGLSGFNLKKDIIVVIVISYIAAYMITIVTIQLNSPQYGVRIKDFRVNEPAPEDFIVQRDNISYIDKNATRERKEASAKLVLPIFNMDDNISITALEKFKLFHKVFSDAFQAGSSPQMIHTNLQYFFPDLIELFGDNEISAVLALFPEPDKVFQSAQKLLTELLDRGYFGNLDAVQEQYPNIFTSGKLELYKNRYYSEKIPVNTVIRASNLQEWIDDKTKTMPLNEVHKSLVRLFINAFAMENCFYNIEETRARQTRESEQVPPVIKFLTKGKPIVLKNEIVTEEAMEKILAQGESDISLNINNYLETGLYLIIIYTLALFLLNKNVLKITIKKSQIYLFIFTGLFYLLLACLLFFVPWNSSWIPYSVLIPTATLSIIITIIISSNAGFIFSLLCSMLILLVTNMNTNAFIFSFLSGVGGCFAALKTEKRIDLIRSGFMLAFFNFFILMTLGFVNNYKMEELPAALGWSLAQGFLCGVLSVGFLPVFEHMLNAATRFRLMELSDLNSPIFKKMLTLAPGTYNHSVFIANLAESVCMEIGANPLLARVGAYYHDIGKIDQADYFIENQRASNKHDELKPTLSAAIIKSHVKIGIEKARELRLPQDVVDIIAQHHGKGLIAYFYQRAISENSNIPASEFSYNTQRPQTKEAAVVMLADVIEAASRTLRRPTIGKLEKFIWSIILDRFNTGELSESNLTLNDLEIIKNKLVQLMAGHFHSRIEYPKIKEAGK